VAYGSSSGAIRSSRNDFRILIKSSSRFESNDSKSRSEAMSESSCKNHNNLKKKIQKNILTKNVENSENSNQEKTENPQKCFTH
jgi:hypothetical protein